MPYLYQPACPVMSLVILELLSASMLPVSVPSMVWGCGHILRYERIPASLLLYNLTCDLNSYEHDGIDRRVTRWPDRPSLTNISSLQDTYNL